MDYELVFGVCVVFFERELFDEFLFNEKFCYKRRMFGLVWLMIILWVMENEKGKLGLVVIGKEGKRILLYKWKKLY